MDPLTDVFNLLDVRAAQFARLEAERPWGIRFNGYRHVKLGAVLRGSCEVSSEGLAQPVRLSEGDCYLLGNGRPYWLRSGAGALLVASEQVFKDFTEGDTLRCGSTPENVVLGCSFHFEETNASVLLDVLPAVVHIPASCPHAEPIRSYLHLLETEAVSPGLGSQVVIERLGHIMLVQVLRAHIAAEAQSGGAWLTALADPQIGAALALVHESPAHRWTVTELASKVGLSRSSFFARFTRLVGMPPLEYLARWRIRAAAKELRRGTRTVSSIAGDWGYGSESAFGHAFKRIMGTSPGQYRASARSQPDIAVTG